MKSSPWTGKCLNTFSFLFITNKATSLLSPRMKACATPSVPDEESNTSVCTWIYLNPNNVPNLKSVLPNITCYEWVIKKCIWFLPRNSWSTTPLQLLAFKLAWLAHTKTTYLTSPRPYLPLQNWTQVYQWSLCIKKEKNYTSKLYFKHVGNFLIFSVRKS